MKLKLPNLFIKRRPSKTASKRSRQSESDHAVIQKEPAAESFPQIFVLESFFLRKLITTLTPGINEELNFLTGPKIGPIRIVCRMADAVMLDGQSPVSAKASAKSVADILIPIMEQGAELHIIAHSHPGYGMGATTPSDIDTECLGRLQKCGSQVIGCIVTRDACVRFFTVSTQFQVLVLGAGVKELAPNVFQITYEDCH